jgi:hypothetical protein
MVCILSEFAENPAFKKLKGGFALSDVDQSVAHTCFGQK